MSGYPRFALYTSNNGMVSMTEQGITKEPIRVCMKKMAMKHAHQLNTAALTSFLPLPILEGPEMLGRRRSREKS